MSTNCIFKILVMNKILNENLIQDQIQAVKSTIVIIIDFHDDLRLTAKFDIYQSTT